MLVHPFIDRGGVLVGCLPHESGDANRTVIDTLRVGARRGACRREAVERPSSDVGLGPVA
jgi:hypothetical protein